MSAAPRAIAPIPPGVNAWNAEYLEAQYRQYKADPSGTPADLRAFFQGFDLAMSRGGGGSGGGGDLKFHAGVADLIEAYRSVGHLAARIDPFGRQRQRPPTLDLARYGVTEADLDRTVSHGTLPLAEPSSLREIVAFLEKTYCGTIGLQSNHLSDTDERSWLIRRFESIGGRLPLSRGDKVHIHERLLRSEQFEAFLQKRYQGEKRFSLEGGESTIPLLDRAIEAASDLGVEEIVLGMAHRGRLNVLNNIMGKSYEQIFTEFEDSWIKESEVSGGGDVKYHRGYSGERQLKNGRTVYLAMASNPSHLESVDPVVLGRCRAKQRIRGDKERSRVIPMLLHGDAAFIGQGIVAETLNLSNLEGYTCGGCVHVVVNNMVGFTTGPQDARSTRYCTDMGLMIEAPVFHVNGMDPEAVVTVAQIAMEYRQRFKKDVIVDLVCYRKYGHNEQDEASFTQPVLTRLVREQRGVFQTYTEQLFAEGILTAGDLETIRQRLDEALENAQKAARAKPRAPTIEAGSRRWQGFGGAYSLDPVQTGAPMEMIEEVCAALGRVPEGFNLNPKLKRLLEERAALPKTAGKHAVSYADAESIAFGTLLLEGHRVRLSGQDVRRGTFSHRHAVLRDFETEERYVPLNNMRPIGESPDDFDAPAGAGMQARMCVYDSPLSEEAVLGFEYGYSLGDPRMLIMWEAQFGDFVNGAQTIIDQYIASAEVKWERWSGLVLLLPHGYEGAGPEHSSARIERFLQLCGNDNMQVVYPTTAAQCFHMFRRQLKARWRKPLIVATPKSMLRVPTSDITELTSGHFRHLIDDPALAGEARGADPKKVRRVLFCSGKIYHELAGRRDALGGRPDTAIVRVEQLYPFDAPLARQILSRYPNATERIWVQEEPRNMGGYLFIADIFRSQLGLDLAYIGRAMSATPAVGSKTTSKHEQESILTQAIGALPKDPKPSHAPESHERANGNGSGNGPATAPKPAAKAKAGR